MRPDIVIILKKKTVWDFMVKVDLQRWSVCCTFHCLFACFKGIWTFGDQTCRFGDFRVVLDMFNMIQTDQSDHQTSKSL